MDLNDILAMLRTELHDEEEAGYRWSDDVLKRHIARAVREFSLALPLESKVVLATTAGSRSVDVSSLTSRISIEAVEYPLNLYPPSYQGFTLWGDILNLTGLDVPDGSDCCIYFAALHRLEVGECTIPEKFLELISGGASGYAALEMSVYSINRLNLGGNRTAEEWMTFADKQLAVFRSGLKCLGRRNTVRVRRLYLPHSKIKSRNTDPGPL